jgi:hypothetical protein
MSHPVINLVTTRATQGDHMALQRWYSDHVGLLMAAPELAQATLYRCTHLHNMHTTHLQGAGPDYACVYAFADHEAFLRYEHGQPKAAAGLLTDAAPGRSSVEIVQRVQYARFLHRRWYRPRPPSWSEGADSRSELGLCLKMAQADQFANQLMDPHVDPLSTQRWLADVLQQLHACSPLVAAQAYMRVDAPDQVWMKLQAQSASLQPLSQVLQALQWLLESAEPTPGFGQRPDGGTTPYTIEWAAQLQRLSRWRR